jgi:hypothetical protein
MGVVEVGIGSGTLFSQMFNVELPSSYSQAGLQDNLNV